MKRLDQLPRTSSKRLAAWLILGNVALGLVLSLVIRQYISETRQSDLRLAEQIADTLAVTVSSEVAAELRLIDNALQSIRQRLPSAMSATDREFQTKLTVAIRDQSALLPFVYAFRFADLNGHVASSRQGPAVNVADRMYFSQAMRSDELVVSEPVISRVSGEWVIILARQVKGSDGRPLGVVYAALLTKHFDTLFSRIALGSGGAVTLRTRELRLVARFASGEPATDKDLGNTRVSSALTEAIARNPIQGTFTTRTKLDGIERVNAYRGVSNFNLILLAGLSSDQFLDDWGKDQGRVWGVGILIQLMLLGGSIYAFIQHRRERNLRHLTSMLAKEQSMLIDNQWIGVLRIKDRTIQWVNIAAVKMLGFEAEEMIGKTTRNFYWEDQTYDRIGQEGYTELAKGGSYHTQAEMKSKNGSSLWVDLTGVALSNGESAWVMVDITNIKRQESAAQHEALHDPLTGLANRRLFQEQLKLIRAQSLRTKVGWAICFLDLDGFKPVNDTYGHDAGDEVLKEVAHRLQTTIRGCDFVARMGGDEFAIVLTGVSESEDVRPTVQRCLDAIKHPITLSIGEIVSIGSSAGIAISHHGEDDPHTLLVAADEAMYKVKRSGKGKLFILPMPKGSAVTME